MRALCAGLVLLAVLVAARGLERRNTWYLASDQFAFLTFADDLAHGRIFHDASALRLLTPDGRDPERPVDAYYQTYLWRDGRLYSRYPPGFPALLAAAGVVGGEPARHALNPALWLAMLLLAAVLAGDVADDRATASAATATAAWLLLVVPADLHYWGITVARDVPAHALALAAVAVAAGGRALAAGVLLGIAATIRPDALLYGVAVGPLVCARATRRGLLRAGVGLVVGIAPLLAYNLATGGHPFAFTQGSEFRDLLSRAAVAPPPPHAVDAPAAAMPVAGGGFSLGHLPLTLPAHLRYLAGAFGLLLVPAAFAVGHAFLARVLATYALVATLFYSCWGHPDARYLVGVAVTLVVLAAAGCARAAAWARQAAGNRAARAALAVALLVAAAAAPAVLPRRADDRTSGVERTVAAALATATLAGGIPSLAPAACTTLLPAALAILGLMRVARGADGRDPVQEPQVARARAALGALLPRESLVIVVGPLGRPAENVTHYVGVEAHYVDELAALGSTPVTAATQARAAGRRVFVLRPALTPGPIGGDVRTVAWRSGDELLDWFVDPASASDGAVIEEAVAPATPAPPPAPPGAPS